MLFSNFPGSMLSFQILHAVVGSCIVYRYGSCLAGEPRYDAASPRGLMLARRIPHYDADSRRAGGRRWRGGALHFSLGSSSFQFSVFQFSFSFPLGFSVLWFSALREALQFSAPFLLSVFLVFDVPVAVYFFKIFKFLGGPVFDERGVQRSSVGVVDWGGRQWLDPVPVGARSSFPIFRLRTEACHIGAVDLGWSLVVAGGRRR